MAQQTEPLRPPEVIAIPFTSPPPYVRCRADADGQVLTLILRLLVRFCSLPLSAFANNGFRERAVQVQLALRAEFQDRNEQV